jgi:hypothetical protein
MNLPAVDCYYEMMTWAGFVTTSLNLMCSLANSAGVGAIILYFGMRPQGWFGLYTYVREALDALNLL